MGNKQHSKWSSHCILLNVITYLIYFQFMTDRALLNMPLKTLWAEMPQPYWATSSHYLLCLEKQQIICRTRIQLFWARGWAAHNTLHKAVRWRSPMLDKVVFKTKGNGVHNLLNAYKNVIHLECRWAPAASADLFPLSVWGTRSCYDRRQAAHNKCSLHVTWLNCS